MKIDFIGLIKSIPSEKLQLKALDRILNWAIPFNRGLGIELKDLSQDVCRIQASPRKRQKNHVNGAHACFLALLAEYPAGLLLAQYYPTSNYRLIISELHMTYSKQGRGVLSAQSVLQKSVAPVIEDEQFVPMTTEIRNSQNELVARGETLWQIKPWDKVRAHS